MNKKMVIGILGEAGVGKSTIGSILCNYITEDEGFCSRLSIARPLKVAASALTSMDAFSPEFKTRYIFPGITGRRLMVGLGEGLRRSLDPDIWVKFLNESVEDTGFSVVVDDVRYPNEVEYFIKNKGVVVYLTRPCYTSGIVEEASVSEAAEKYEKFSRFIHIEMDNNPDPYYLCRLTTDIYKKIKEKY